MAEALYRKYRPQVFEDMVGQEHIERTLKNAIEQDKVSHAYLFCGPRGTGKTTTARLLAKALLCENGPTSSPDGTCRECEEVAEGTHPDVYELDAASRTGVENVREEIIGRVNFAPTRGKKKIYIIDEVHMLSTAAFNALLKTLEEPPSHVVFVLCTTDPQKVPATIHSRCQRFDFHRLGTDEIVSRLGAVCVGEGVEFEGDALAIVAHRADGGMRNALTSLEQLIAFGNGAVTVQGAEDLLGSLDSSDMAEIVRAVGRRDVAACFNWTANYVESGADLAQFARDLAQRIRNMYVMCLVGADVALEVPDAERREMAEELRLFGPDRLARILALLGDLISELRTSGNPRLCFEIALTRMVRPDSDLTLESLAERVEALEAGKSAVATYVPAAAPAPAAVPAAAASAPAAIAAAAAMSATAAPAAPPASDSHAQQVSSSLASIVTNPAALQRVWRSVVTAVKKERVSYGVLFVNVRVRAEADGSGVVVEFPADNPFAYNMALKPDVLDTMQRAFDQVAGVHVPFRCAQAQAAPAPAAPSAPVPLSQTPSRAASSPDPAPAAPQPAPDPAPAAPQPAPAPAPQQPAPAAPRPAPAAPQPAPASATAPVPAPQQPASAAPQPRAEASRQAPPPQQAPAIPQQAPAPEGSAGPMPAVASAPAPYDEVPLDVYDSMAPAYEDEEDYGTYAPSHAGQAAVQRASAVPGPAPAPAPAARPSAPPRQFAPAGQAPADASSAPTWGGSPTMVPGAVAPVESAASEAASVANADDLSKMISGSMGVNVVFEEVDE